MFSRPIVYPSDFTERVVAAVPNDPDIRGLLDNGSGFAVLNRLNVNGKTALAEEWQQIFDRRPKDSLLVAFIGV